MSTDSQATRTQLLVCGNDPAQDLLVRPLCQLFGLGHQATVVKVSSFPLIRDLLNANV